MDTTHELNEEPQAIDAEDLECVAGGYFSMDSDFDFGLNPIVAAKVLPRVNWANVVSR